MVKAAPSEAIQQRMQVTDRARVERSLQPRGRRGGRRRVCGSMSRSGGEGSDRCDVVSPRLRLQESVGTQRLAAWPLPPGQHRKGSGRGQLSLVRRGAACAGRWPPRAMRRAALLRSVRAAATKDGGERSLCKVHGLRRVGDVDLGGERGVEGARPVPRRCGGAAWRASSAGQTSGAPIGTGGGGGRRRSLMGRGARGEGRTARKGPVGGSHLRRSSARVERQMTL